MSQVEAYVHAGYKRNDSASARLFGNVRIKQRIAELTAPVLDRYAVTADNITREMALIAFHRAKDYRKFLASGNLDDVTSEESAAIKEVKTLVDTEGNSRIEVKFADKMQPLNILARIVGLTTDQNISMPVTFTIEWAQPKDAAKGS